MFRRAYGQVFDGDELWRSLPVAEGGAYEWSDTSTYVRRPPYFDGMPDDARPAHRHRGAPVPSPCSATASRPTTSPPPAPSAPTARPGGG